MEYIDWFVPARCMMTYVLKKQTERERETRDTARENTAQDRKTKRQIETDKLKDTKKQTETERDKEINRKRQRDKQKLTEGEQKERNTQKIKSTHTKQQFMQRGTKNAFFGRDWQE